VGPHDCNELPSESSRLDNVRRPKIAESTAQTFSSISAFGHNFALFSIYVPLNSHAESIYALGPGVVALFKHARSWLVLRKYPI
jgi:hypothetical protein